MLQQANIGIGIIGKEGNAAANFSDIAVPTFQGLRRLMFYHGRRLSSNLESFYVYQTYKNQLLVFTSMLANSSSKWSAVSPYLGLYTVSYLAQTMTAGSLFLIAD